jgi:hypothetical protein
MFRLLDSSATARDLARLLAGWLAAIVLVQAVAAAQGLVLGARHRHLGPAVDVVAANAATLYEPDAITVAVAHQHQAHHHHHDAWERHLHAGGDGHDATSAPGDDAQDDYAAAGAVLIALSGVLPGAWPAWHAGGLHVLHARPAWQPVHGWARTPERPPRA